MVFKKNNPGCEASACSCAVDGCELLGDDFGRPGPQPGSSWSVKSGDWSIAAGQLETPDAGALIATAGAHTSSAMVAEARIFAETPGDRLRVVVAFASTGNYLFGELEFGGDCGEGRLRLYRVAGGTPVELASLAAEDAVVDRWHTLRVCYVPGEGGSSPSDPSGGGAGVLSARLRTDWLSEVYRYLEAEDVPASGRRAGLGTGELGDVAAGFDDFAWYQHADDGDLAGCPDCAAGCEIFSDGFLRDPVEQDDPGCNWQVLPAGTGSAVTRLSSSGGAFEVRLTQDTVAVALIEHPDGSSHMRAEVAIGVGADDVAEIRVAYLDEDNFLWCTAQGFATGPGSPAIYEFGVLTIGQRIAGVTTTLESVPVFTAGGTLAVCFNGATLTAELGGDGSSNGFGGTVAAAAEDPGGTRAALAAPAVNFGYLPFQAFALSKLEQGCAGCRVECSHCLDGLRPGSFLVVLSGFSCASMNVVFEVYNAGLNQSIGECVYFPLALTIDHCLPGVPLIDTVWLAITAGTIDLVMFSAYSSAVALTFKKTFAPAERPIDCQQTYELEHDGVPTLVPTDGTVTIIPQ